MITQRRTAGLLGFWNRYHLYNIIYHRYLYYIHTHRDNKILYYINNLKSILYNTGGAYIPPRISKIGHFNGVVPLVIEWTSLFYNQWLDLSNSNSVIIPQLRDYNIILHLQLCFFFPFDIIFAILFYHHLTTFDHLIPKYLFWIT